MKKKSGQVRDGKGSTLHTWVASATHFPVSGPGSFECSSVARTPT